MSNLKTWRDRELLTAAQMRALERHAMDHAGVTGLTLMERAGRGVVDALLAHWPELAQAPRRAVVLCGPGNNGGDGFVLARLLRNRGWAVEVILYGDPDRLAGDARGNHDRWASMGEVRRLGFPTVTPQEASEVAQGAVAASDVVVDAIFGTGLVRPPDGLGALFEALRRGGAGPRRVAVDVPTGLCADSGRVFRGDGDAEGGCACLGAELTVTFGHAKPGHVLGRGPDLCGRLVLCDIGLPALPRDGGDGRGTGESPGPVLPVGAPEAGRIGKRSGHKYDHGHALVLAGGFGRTGAARLAARGALRVGAGLVTVAAPAEAMAECAAQLTAIMLRRCDGAQDLADLLRDRRLNAVALGPGLGAGQGTRDVVAAVLDALAEGGASAPSRSAILDADALTAFEDDPAALFEKLARSVNGEDRVVLTPHMGEFARLFPDIAARLDDRPERGPLASRIDAVRAAADRASAVVLLKGAATVIATPGGGASVHAAVYDRAAPWLATAGAGDVLSGLIAGLLARGFGARSAAEAGAWLHVEAALEVGPGLIAEDLPDAMPQVLRRIGDAGEAERWPASARP
ncbi:NAD(P)H-hydrate dehydratase [Roseibacterium sp. SDUM158017]|uniref:NAD(P)H-hydrate dehydratase n=1 Tax=Roseicyclus salinarum TaxID=3036773 RepID=UPI00241512CC|nr:NAD(P)H-hydrate dehydratase [Roseibacterium sp. SDUM158017]MDG4649779.1 NAD(P)H-hydrate dehydratase [Roseibacterium sp. SDUM158017]